MRSTFRGAILASLLLPGMLLLLPSTAQAQYYEVPPTIFTGFLSHPRYENGGFFTAFNFLYMATNPVIGRQQVAVRGFTDIDGSITGKPGTFVGSGDEALNTRQLQGNTDYRPGFNITVGWRCENGVTFMLSWWHLLETRHFAGANPIPPGLNLGAQLENTFLTAPVTNYPLVYGGNPQNVTAGNPGATLGIWNAAGEMTISFLQRFELVEFTTRIPIYQNECDRAYGTFGPRAVILWDRFFWRAIDQDLTGAASASTVADYTNIVSNRLYGPFVGCGYERYLGSSPLGAFSVTFDFDAGLYLNFVKERASYELEDRSTRATRSQNTYTLAPGLQGKLLFWWYPWEAISVNAGWDGLVFFNTVSSQKPIDFNFGSINPEYNRTFARFYHGLSLGVCFVF